MHSVTVRNITPLDAVDLKFQLVRAGLVMDDDFSWEYIPYRWDNFTGNDEGKYVVFHFQDPALATFYQLKWTR